MRSGHADAMLLQRLVARAPERRHDDGRKKDRSERRYRSSTNWPPRARHAHQDAVALASPALAWVIFRSTVPKMVMVD